MDDSFVGSCWAHAARIFSISAELRIRCLPDVFLEKRGDNDSFLTGGLTRRFALAIDGYHRIADAFFGHDSVGAAHPIVHPERALAFRVGRRAERLDVDENRPEQYPEFRRLVRKQFSDASWDLWKRIALELAPPRGAAGAQTLPRRAARAARAPLSPRGGGEVRTAARERGLQEASFDRSGEPPVRYRPAPPRRPHAPDSSNVLQGLRLDRADEGHRSSASSTSRAPS